MLRNFFLILIALSILPLGLFFMKRLDRYLDAEQEKKDDLLRGTGRSGKAEGKENVSGPSRIYLTENTSDEDILKEISAFREKHKHISIVICEEKGDRLSEEYSVTCKEKK